MRAYCNYENGRSNGKNDMLKRGRNPVYFLLVATGIFLSTMDSSMINIALPNIMEAFGIGLGQVEWVVLVYLLTVTSLLLIWGKLADRFGRRAVYIAGVLVFSLGAFTCSVSPSFMMLVSARLVQGVGASMIMATGPAIMKTVVPRANLGKWLGALGIATSFGLMCGPIAGGYILQHHPWPYIFFISGIVSVIILVFGALLLFAESFPGNMVKGQNTYGVGATYWIIFTVLLVVSVNGAVFETKLLRMIGVVAAFCSLALLLVHDLRSKTPFLPVILLKRRYYSIAMLSAALSFCVLYFVIILMPFYLYHVLDLSYQVIGYIMMAIPVSLLVISPFAGVLFDRFGGRYLTTSGITIVGVGIVSLLFVDEQAQLYDLAWRLCLLGGGMAIFASPNTAAVLSRVPLGKSGVTSGMLATSRNFGMLLGVAFVGYIFTLFFSKLSGGETMQQFTPSLIPIFLRSFRYTLLCGAVVAFAAAALSFFRK